MTKAFVVGHPIRHSRSPLIHGFWLEEHGIAGTYERIDVPPAEFPDFLRQFADEGYAGGNVTIPHKEAAFAHVDRRTPRADRLKAVNTLWLEDGLIWGDNTDGIGFMAHLDQSLGGDWEARHGSVLVLGAGGAARAVVAGLLDRPIQHLRIANRTAAKATDLLDDLGYGSEERARAVAWDRLDDALEDASLIVNTTAAGMNDHAPLAVDLARAPPHAAVADIVYVPLKTPLLAAAEARGLTTVDGLGMLLHQAVPGFARWFGVTPTVTAKLRSLVVSDLEQAR